MEGSGCGYAASTRTSSVSSSAVIFTEASCCTATPSRVLARTPLTSTLPVADALSWLRRNNSHLSLVTTDGYVTAMVALEDLVEDLVGVVRDGTHRV